jgi:hypothetical protein
MRFRKVSNKVGHLLPASVFTVLPRTSDFEVDIIYFVRLLAVGITIDIYIYDSTQDDRGIEYNKY